MNKIYKCAFFSTSCLMMAAILIGEQNNPIEINLSDHILKVGDQGEVFLVGDNNVAVFDRGDCELKFFNREVKFYHKIPLKKGDGPGEIRGVLSSVLVKNGVVYMLEFQSSLLHCYKLSGELVRDVRLPFVSNDMVEVNNKIVFTLTSIDFNKKPIVIGKSMSDGKFVKFEDITLSRLPQLPIILVRRPEMTPFFTVVKFLENGEFILFITISGELFKFDRFGAVVKSIKLPFVEPPPVMDGTGGLSTIEYFYDIKTIDNALYLSHIKEVRKKGKISITNNIIIVNTNGKYVIRALVGKNLLFNKIANKSLFFDTIEYKLSSIIL